MLLYLLSISEDEVQPDVVKLYYSHVDEMTKITVKRLKDIGDTNCLANAQDIIQNVFVSTVKYMNSLPKSSEREQRAYLYAMLKNEINHFVGKYAEPKKESYELTDFPDDHDFIEALEMKERYNEVVDAICELDEKYSTVLLFRFVREYAPSKIAKILKISTPAVYKRLNKGKVLLIDALRKNGGEYP